MKVVLRARQGQQIEVVDSSGAAFEAALSFAGERAIARLERKLSAAAEPQLQITLAQALPKGQKMDFIVEKATELGVARIVPLLTERTVATSARPGKAGRWKRIARSAATQCGRRDLPEVEDAIAWDDFCVRIGSFERVFLPWELAEREPLRERLPRLLGGAHNVAIAIGPEGGFSHAEVERASAAGALTLSLGQRILRTETAGLVACSILLYAGGEL